MNRIPNARKVGSTQFLLLAYKYMIAAKTKLMIAAFDWKSRIKTASPTNNGVSTLLLLPDLINSTNPQMLRTHKKDPTFGFSRALYDSTISYVLPSLSLDENEKPVNPLLTITVMIEANKTMLATDRIVNPSLESIGFTTRTIPNETSTPNSLKKEQLQYQYKSRTTKNIHKLVI